MNNPLLNISFRTTNCRKTGSKYLDGLKVMRSCGQSSPVAGNPDAKTLFESGVLLLSCPALSASHLVPGMTSFRFVYLVVAALGNNNKLAGRRFEIPMEGKQSFYSGYSFSYLFFFGFSFLFLSSSFSFSYFFFFPFSPLALFSFSSLVSSPILFVRFLPFPNESLFRCCETWKCRITK